MQAAEQASPEQTVTWFVQPDYAGAKPRARKIWQLRLDDEGSTSAHAVIVASLFLVVLAGSLLFGQFLGKELQTRGLHYTPHYTLPLMGHRRRELVDAAAGVYRYDQLIVLRMTRMPAVLLEAGSIVNRQEELELASPERRSLTSAAVVAAVEDFCAARTRLAPPKAAAQRGHATAGAAAR